MDTGFNGYLTLDTGTITELGWPLRDTGGFLTGDGREVFFDIHLGEIDWYDRRRKAYVLATGGECLIGTWLLQGGRLTVDFLDGGSVSIGEIPAQN